MNQEKSRTPRSAFRLAASALRSVLTLLLVLFTTASSWAEDYYVAEYAAATHTLTFKKSTTAPNNTTSWDASNTGDYEPGWHGLGTNITTVVFEESFKAARPTSCSIWFFYFSNLTTVTDMEKYLNTSSVTNMAGMFSGCSSLTSLDVSNWATGSVTLMADMFAGCSSLTSLDVSKWDTSSVESMDGMFSGCSSLTSLDVSNWVTGSVTGMGSMFSGCSSLTSLDVSNFDTDKVNIISDMFNGCSSLTSLDMSGWSGGELDSPNALLGLFYGCSSLTSLSIGGTFYFFSGITSSILFDGCTALANGTLIVKGTEVPKIIEDIFSGVFTNGILVTGLTKEQLGITETTPPHTWKGGKFTPAVTVIGANGYATLQDALAAVSTSGTEITMLDDSNESTLTSTVPGNMSVTIDLNGKTVSVDKFETTADLTLKNGTLVCNTLSNTNTDGENTLTIDKATVTVNTNLAWNANNIILQNAAKVTVNTAMWLAGSANDGNNGADFTIADGASTFTLVECTVNGSNPDRVAAKMSPYVQPGHESELTVDGTTKNSMTLRKNWGVLLASGLGEKAKVEFYDGGETEPDATTFDPSAYKPFGEEGANEIKVYDNSAGADRYIIVHVVPTGFEYWTDASLLSMQETGASVTGTASALTLLKRDTYDSDSKTYTRYDGAGWYCYKLPGEHTVAAGYSNSTLGGDVVKTFNLDPANSTEGTFTQNGNEVILTNGEGWQASLTYDKISWTFDGQSHHPATTTITVTKGDKTLKLTSATDIAQQIVDGEEYNPAAIATHYIKIGAKPYSWFKQSQYNIATFSITVPFPGKGTEAEPWLVQGAKNLVLLAQCVNTGCYSFDREYVKLDNGEGYSYDMSAEAGFEPIGLIDDEHFTPFCGIFDGNGVTISGINYTYSSNPSVVGDAGRYCIGLFGQLGHSAADPADRKESAVKNLTLCNCTFASTSNQVCYVGGVVGYIDNGSLTDVSVSGCNISATKDGSRVGAIASGVNTATLTRNYYKYDTKVTLGKAVATDYAKRGIGTATGGDDVATNDGAMLWVKKASLGDITKPTGSGGTVAFAEHTPGVNCYAVDGDNILYAVGKSVSLSVSPGTSTDGIRTFGDELAALTMNDGTSNTDIKDARAFTMPKTDVTISGTLSLSDWFTIQTNGNRWMSFYQEWGNYAVSGVSSGASGTRRGGLLIELLTIGGIDFSKGIATLKDLGGSSFKGVPMFFHCEDGLPEQLRFDPVEGKTAPEHDGQFKGGVSDLSAFAGQAVFVLFGSELARVDLSGSTAFDPNKAFVAAAQKSATRLALVRDGATAIDLVTTPDEGEGKWFDLQGRQLDGKPSKKGLYIRDGKKVIIN